MRLAGLSVALWLGGAASALATEVAPPRLELTHVKQRSASLLDAPDALPPSLQLAMSADLESQLTADAESFARAMADGDPFAGGGDRAQAHGDPVVAFVVGMFAGLGLAHLFVAREINRGIVWMAVDAGILSLMIIFFVAAGPVGAIFLIAFVLERVVQGLDAMAGVAKPGFPFGEAAPSDPSGRFAALPRPFTPNVLSLTF